MRVLIRLAVFVAFVGGVGSTVPAVADGGDATVTGGDVSGPGMEATVVERRAALAKLRGATAYYESKLRSGRASPPAKSLALTYRAQQEFWYCGPASGIMMLQMLKAGPSKVTGAIKTQRNLADAAHMRTDINRATPWASHLFRIGLNKWRQGKATGYYVDFDSPGYVDFKRMLVADVDRGYPIGADTVELRNDTHYNNHPRSKLIGHWIVGYGYSDYGGASAFADPSTSVWKGVNKTFTAPVNSFVPKFLHTNGIVW